MKSPYSAKDEKALMTEIWDPQIADNPYNFVKFIFPWGKEGTLLQKYKEPRSWQIDELLQIADHIKANKQLEAEGKIPKIYKSATASGRGVGKSALVSWLNYWMMSCHLGSTGITTANTSGQLQSKTWAELGKWHTLAMNSHWFERMSLKLIPTEGFKILLETKLKIPTGYYYSEAQLWSEENPDSFAGAHNPLGIIVIFDESSGIPAPIWQVTEGFFTEVSVHRYWFNFSNPRRNTGPFYECFHKDRDYWFTRNLDSRKVEDTDVNHLNSIVERYGEDSDEARIEVKGLFPSQGDRQFISREAVDGAMLRELSPDHHAGLIMGIDIARYGDDATMFYFRRGRDARSIAPIKLKGKDNMEVANEAAYWIDYHKPDAVCIDSGAGSGVIDRLREMGYKVHEVMFGGKADEEEWADKRTEMWARLREWLPGGCIPQDQHLKDDLVGPEYEFTKGDKLKLEAKEKMKKRGLSSPDAGDALALTFAVRVARSDMKVGRRDSGRRVKVAHGVDGNVFD